MKDVKLRASLEKYYITLDRANRYSFFGKRKGEIERLLEEFSEFFGEKILDVCCGGGALGMLVHEKVKRYVGVDANGEMIRNARDVARKLGAKNCSFFLCDVRKFAMREKFDTIACLGNSLCHLDVFDWIEVVKNVNEVSEKNAHFIIEYRDVVNLLFEKKWKDVTVFEENGKLWVDVSKEMDTKSGKIWKFAFSPQEQRSWMEFFHAVWSPFILRSVMRLLGWRLVGEKKVEEWDGYVEVYEKL